MKANETRLAKLLGTRDMRLADVAKALKVNKTTVSRWAHKEVPTDRLADVERVTGIPVQDLRPDLASVFAPAEQESAA